MNIPTWEEIVKKHTITNPEENWERNGKFEITDYKSAATEFVKIHVKQALLAATNEADFTSETYQSMQQGSIVEIDKDSILNAYSESNIK